MLGAVKKAALGAVWGAVVLAFGLACGGDAENTLIVYSGRSEVFVAPLVEQFEAQSGVRVRVRYADTNLLAATLLEEGDATDADVFFAQAPGALVAVDDLLATLPNSVLDLAEDWAVPAGRKWVGTSARARVAIYNTDLVSAAELPNSIEDFTHSRWRGRIGWAPTNASFQAMVAGMVTIWGEARTRAWLDGIQANRAEDYSGNTPIVAATIEGEVAVGFVNHYYLHRAEAEAGALLTARNHYFPASDPGATLLLSGAGILANSANGALAEQFVRFLLSNTAQTHFVNATYEVPVAGITTTPRPNDANSGIPTAAQFADAQIDFASVADIETAQNLLRESGVLP